MNCWSQNEPRKYKQQRSIDEQRKRGTFWLVPPHRWNWKTNNGSGAPRVSNSGQKMEEHTSELQSRRDLVCRLLLEKKKKIKKKEDTKKVTIRENETHYTITMYVSDNSNPSVHE